MSFETPLDRNGFYKGVSDYLTEAVRKALDDATRTCLNCEHFIEGPPDRSGEKCGLNHMMPPPSIAARGCDNHLDKIPF
jgi:hypothetical protein